MSNSPFDFWQQLNFYFGNFAARQEYMTEKIASIVCSYHDPRARSLLLSWLPEYMDVSTERTFKETIRVNDERKLCSLHTGSGYVDEGALAERTYCMRDGIKYNFSKWKLLNLNQIG